MLHVIRCADCCTGIQYRTTYFRITFQFRLDIRSTWCNCVEFPFYITFIFTCRPIFTGLHFV